jgi:hypothetical protein
MVRWHRSLMWPLATNVIRLFLVGIAWMGLALANAAAYPNASSGLAIETAPDQGPDELFTVTVDEGLLFLNGEFIPSPHRIVATVDGVTINDRPYRPKTTLENSERIETQPQRRRDRNRRLEFTSAKNPRGNRESHQVQLARECSNYLAGNCIVVHFDGKALSVLSPGSQQFGFFQALVATPPDENQALQLVQLAGDLAAQESWRNWLSDFKPSDELRQEMVLRLDVLKAVEASNLRQNAAVGRMARFSYPLTMVSMMIGVIGLGHVLKWAGHGFVDREDDLMRKISADYVKLAIIFMACMGTLDLVWTILAAQAGVMREVNPLASGLIHSPTALTLFKVAALSVSFAIFYTLRSRPIVQQAVWWMCLVSVLLTFRWVVVDSLVG